MMLGSCSLHSTKQEPIKNNLHAPATGPDGTKASGRAENDSFMNDLAQ